MDMQSADKQPLRTCSEDGCKSIFRPPEAGITECPKHRGEASKYRPRKMYDNESILNRMDGERQHPTRPRNFKGLRDV